MKKCTLCVRMIPTADGGRYSGLMGGFHGHKATRAPSQYPKRRLSVRSRKVSKPRDWYFKLSYRFEIWQAHRQHCCRSACQISERYDNSKYKSRGFEILRDLTGRRLFGYWDGAQGAVQYLIYKTWYWNVTQSFQGTRWVLRISNHSEIWLVCRQ